MNNNSERLISASRLRLRIKSPFFATLALFADFKPTYNLQTAATDGQNIYFNPDFLSSLPPAQQDGLILHEVLHAALLHIFRRGSRIPKLWNIAADIVVNGLIMEQGQFELFPNGIREPKWEKFSVEEIYELLLKKSQEATHDNKAFPFILGEIDLLGSPLDENDQQSSEFGIRNSELGYKPLPSERKEFGRGTSLLPNNFNSELRTKSSELERSDFEADIEAGGNQPATFGSIAQASEAKMRAHWNKAFQQAALVARSINHGNLPAGIERQLEKLSQAQIDWRTYLWRYLVQTPTDFQGFERRFVSQGLYLETLAGESIQVFVAVDTSGSVDDRQMTLFLSEVQGILSAYPHIQCELYYADADIYGPYSLTLEDQLPKPVGGGGTSFIPFFEKVEATRNRYLEGICVYLTDGYGNFPQRAPQFPVLWVVTPGGLDLQQFPFGEAVRLVQNPQ